MEHRIAFLGDLHLANFSRFGGKSVAGLNDRAALTLASLLDALTQCFSKGIKHVVLLGDVFDSDRPEPALIHALARVLHGFADMNIDLLVGNHDMTSTAEHHHALSPFNYLTTNVGVYGLQEGHDAYMDGLDIGLLPWGPEPILDRVENFLKTTHVKTLCLHAGLFDAGSVRRGDGPHDVPDACDVEKLSRICEHHRVSRVYAGHWHHSGTWLRHGVILHQVGALVPTSFSDDGPGFGRIVFHDGTILRAKVPHFHVQHGALAPPPIGKFSSWDFVRVIVPREKFAETLEAARTMNNEGLPRTVEVLVDQNDERARLTEAAELAASQTGIVQAIRSYVEKMPTKVSNKDEIIDAVLEKLGLS